MIPPFSIGIPTLNRADLLLPALRQYVDDFPQTPITVLDNGQQGICATIVNTWPDNYFDQLYIPTSKENIGVAASWNFLLTHIFDHPANRYGIIMNDDIYWGRKRDDLALFLEEFERGRGDVGDAFILLPMDTKYDWSVFLISRRAWEMLGKFDETFFPGYFEDRDYEYRAKLADIEVIRLLGAPERFIPSGSVQKDNTLLKNGWKNRNYYVEKWGGEPGKEKFKEPFNGSKTL